MYAAPTLSTRFANSTRVLRSEVPLSENQMREAAPSIFAEGKHTSRSERYTYIPTIFIRAPGAKERVGDAVSNERLGNVHAATKLAAAAGAVQGGAC